MGLGNVSGKMDLVLDLERLNTVVDFQPEDLTATVEAGIAIDTLQAALAQRGMFLPLEAPLAQKATVGGVLAANTSGPRRHAYGLPRDWLIGISVVSADGTETKAGGKVVKNVTGYDLNRLYTGSLGTLGVIVEATFKLAPRPASTAALTASFDSIGAAVDAGRNLLDQPYSPQGVHVLSRDASIRLEQHGGHQASVLAFFEGPGAELVERRVQECSRIFHDVGAVGITSISGPEYSSILGRLTDLGWSSESKPDLMIKINVPPSGVAGLVEKFRQDPLLVKAPGISADVGFGMVRLFWWEGGDSAAPAAFDEPVMLKVIQSVRELANAAGGNAVVELCPLAIKRQIDVWGESPQSIEIMRRIKNKFDPSGILNPGRFVGGI